MESNTCPRCQGSVQIRVDPVDRPGRCAVCGVRLRPAAALSEIAAGQPPLQTAIAAGLPAERRSGVGMTLTYLGRLLFRVRDHRGDIPTSGEPTTAPDRSAMRWLLGIYTWLPAIVITIFLVLGHVAACVFLVQGEFELGPTITALATGSFLVSFVSLVATVRWYRARGSSD